MGKYAEEQPTENIYQRCNRLADERKVSAGTVQREQVLAHYARRPDLAAGVDVVARSLPGWWNNPTLGIHVGRRSQLIQTARVIEPNHGMVDVLTTRLRPAEDTALDLWRREVIMGNSDHPAVVDLFIEADALERMWAGAFREAVAEYNAATSQVPEAV